MRANIVTILGLIITGTGVFWLFKPATPLLAFCLEGRCGFSILSASIVILVGATMLVSGGVSYWESRRPQTMTIALGNEAEKDAAVLETLQSAVAKHQNPENAMPQKKSKRQDERMFIEMPKTERKFRRVR